MPIKPVKPKKKRPQAGLTLCQLQHLILGHTWDFMPCPEYPFKDDEDRRALYHKNKKYVFSRQGKEGEFEKPTFSWGERPAAWWDYEAPEPRKQIAGDAVEPVTSEMLKGVPRMWYERTGTECFETEFVYLKRLGLLFEGEEKRYAGIYIVK